MTRTCRTFTPTSSLQRNSLQDYIYNKGDCQSYDFQSPFLLPVPAFVEATTAPGGPFFVEATKIRIGCRPLMRRGQGATPAAFYLGLCRLRGILSPPSSTTTCRRRAIPHCSGDGAASIPKSGPEIKNHCIARAILEGFPAAIPKLTPSNQESMHARGRKRGNPCIDSQVRA